jgi:hypothetical protein
MKLRGAVWARINRKWAWKRRAIRLGQWPPFVESELPRGILCLVNNVPAERMAKLRAELKAMDGVPLRQVKGMTCREVLTFEHRKGSSVTGPDPVDVHPPSRVD